MIAVCVERLLFGSGIKMFRPEQLYFGAEQRLFVVESLYFTDEMLYFVSESLYSASERLYFMPEQLLLSRERLYLWAVQRLSRRGIFYSGPAAGGARPIFELGVAVAQDFIGVSAASRIGMKKKRGCWITRRRWPRTMTRAASRWG